MINPFPERESFLAQFAQDLGVAGEKYLLADDGSCWALFERIAEQGRIVSVDWRSCGEEVLSGLSRLLKELHGRMVSDMEMAMLERKSFSPWSSGHNGWQILVAAKAFDDFAQGEELRVLWVDAGSDGYGFTIVSPEVFERWHDVHIDRYVQALTPDTNNIKPAQRQLADGPRLEHV